MGGAAAGLLFRGTQHVEVEIPFNAPNNRPCRVLVDDGDQAAPDFTVQATADDRAEALTLPVANHYTLQGQAFAEAIRGGKAPRNDLRSAIANMRVIDAIFRAAESQRWEAV